MDPLPTPFDRLAAAVRRLREETGAVDDQRRLLEAVAREAVAGLDGVERASVSLRQGQRTWTAAATDERACDVDEAQYAAGQGPCVDVLRGAGPVVVPDLRVDPRWPALTAHPLPATGVLAVPLAVEAEHVPATGSLNLYCVPSAARALDAAAVARAALLADQAALATAVVVHRVRARNLEEALVSNRDIGAAVGVLMAMERTTRDEALARLRRASQDGNRKLRDVAAQVLDTGVLEERHPPEGRSTGGPRRARGAASRDGDHGGR
ncbi:GAF and ANTAR domain-containing protein [Kineococcus sp. SYSU DK004]|uniref:GAF and ANTAR domain-containing protein n=1 Tax=Kineococcus sp. SYSU DK004 TaxID=3383125 RepID=UPI003D7E9798